MVRTLPSAQEAARILAVKRSKPIGRPPPAAGRSLAKTMKALDARFGQGAGDLKGRWLEIVGATLARRTEPVKLTKPRAGGGAVLELRVEGPSAAIIQHQAGDILERVNLFLGQGSVDRLRIVQGPLRRRAAQPAQAVSEARRRRQAPLDAAAEQALIDSLSGLPDGRLKRALARLGREVMRGDAR